MIRLPTPKPGVPWGSRCQSPSRGSHHAPPEGRGCPNISVRFWCWVDIYRYGQTVFRERFRKRTVQSLVKTRQAITLVEFLVVIAIVAILALGGWWWLARPHDARRANLLAFETDATADLVNGIMQALDADGPKWYLLTFGEAQTEPSRLFIARFARHYPPMHGLGRSGNGRGAVIIQVERLQRVNDTTLDAVVQFPGEPDDQNRFTYRLTSNGGAWTIKWRLPARKT